MIWAAGAGPANPGGPLTVDLDSTICAVHGRDKQGADYGYTKVRGYHPQLATLAETGQVIFSQLRGGGAGAARGAKSFLTETISRLGDAGATGPLTVRADSAFYSRAMIGTARKLDVRFSITARQDKRIRAAIEAILAQAWAPDPLLAFNPGGPRRRCRRGPLHRVCRDQSSAGCGPPPGSQLALFTTGVTTPWSPTATVTRLSSRPTTAATPWSNSPSPS